MNSFSLITKGPVAQIKLKRPEHGNKLDIPTIRALTETIVSTGQNAEVKVIEIRGEGKDFCLGRQMPSADPGTKPARKTAVEIRQQVTDPILAFYAAIRHSPIPLVAAVNGSAVGLGCALAVSCDVTIAVDNARFSLPELRSDIPPTLAISALMHAVPQKALANLVYSTQEISASEALRLGLLTMTVPASDFDATVAAYLEGLCSRSRVTLSAIKEYMNLAPAQDPLAAARFGSNLLSGVLASQ
jgi:enoyl-CoA hydratase/carnithine racemase